MFLHELWYFHRLLRLQHTQNQTASVNSSVPLSTDAEDYSGQPQMKLPTWAIAGCSGEACSQLSVQSVLLGQVTAYSTHFRPVTSHAVAGKKVSCCFKQLPVTSFSCSCLSEVACMAVLCCTRS